MDDTLKTVIFGFLGMIVFHAGLEKRAKDDAARQVREEFHNTGIVRSSVESRGMFGAIGNRMFAVDIYGSGQSTETLPFASFPKSGWKGHIRHMRLHFDHLTLKGLPVERFDADIPNVSYDLGHALYKDRLLVRGAGEGPASVQIGADGLRLFIQKKYSRTLTDVHVSFIENKVAISGKLLLFGAQSPFLATGDLVPRDGRYVDLMNPIVEMNGKPLAPAFVANVLKQINPVLDIAVDLGLSGYLTLNSVSIGHDSVTVHGLATIPVRPEGMVRE